METESNEKVKYNEIPKQVLRKDFNRDINPHLRKRYKGPKPKLSHYKIFNYILYVLHTGIQWRQLRTRRNELLRLTPKVVHPYLVFIVLPGTTISCILSPYFCSFPSDDILLI